MTPFDKGWGGLRAFVAMVGRCVGGSNGVRRGVACVFGGAGRLGAAVDIVVVRLVVVAALSD